MRRITTCLGVVLLASFLVRSQEVASIKPTDPKDKRILFDGSPGQARYVASLKMLVQYAYNVRGFQLLGGPEWINSDRYTIVAKLPANEAVPPVDPTIATLQKTLQALLADRFQLKIHKEIQILPIYVLRTTRRRPKLTEHVQEAPGANVQPGTIRVAIGRARGSQIELAPLITFLSTTMGRPIQNETGLNGKYDFDLKWTSDESTPYGPFGDIFPGPLAAEAERPLPEFRDGPNIFTALQEQLGLKLDSSKGPVEMIVVDHVEKPSEN